MIRSSSIAAIAERPQVVKKHEVEPAQPANLIICANCQQKRKKCALGLCNTCYAFQLRHGVPRPLHLVRYQMEKQSQPKWCTTCGNPELYNVHRCHACYTYWMRYKKERPKWLWNKDVCCKNCAFPKKAALRGKGGYALFHKGRCAPCYRYKNRTGRERPAHLWGAGKHGFCDCGYPAEHQAGEFNLCNRCVKDYK